jgi:lysophospholipase L1-like esterase
VLRMGVIHWNGLTVAFLLTGLLGPVAAGGIQMKDRGARQEMNPAEKSEKTIVIIGASYAGGWTSERPIAGYRIINKGVNGEQSFEMLSRFEADVVALKPDAVIIWGFINDVFRSDRDRIDQTLIRTRESFLAMVELSKKSGIMPILATEVTIRGKAGWSEPFEEMIGKILGKSSYQEYVNGHVIETNRWLRDLATREGVLLLDLETVLADQHGRRRREFARPDGSHISPQGYEALIRYSEDKIRLALSS